LLKGIRKLREVREKLRKREWRKLAELKRQKGVPGKEEHISRQLRRIRPLDRKADSLLDLRRKRLQEFATHDPEFPRLLNRMFFFDRLAKKLRAKGAHSLIYIDVGYTSSA